MSYFFTIACLIFFQKPVDSHPVRSAEETKCDKKPISNHLRAQLVKSWKEIQLATDSVDAEMATGSRIQVKKGVYFEFV